MRLVQLDRCSALGAILCRLAAVLIPAALLVSQAALPARAGATDVYQDGVLILANVRLLQENSRRERELPPFYDGRIWICHVSPDDSTLIACLASRNPPVLGEEATPPLYRGIEIFFMPGTAPRVFTSVEEIDAAAQDGDIVLQPSDAVFLCRPIAPPVGRRVPISELSDAADLTSTWGRIKSLYR